MLMAHGDNIYAERIKITMMSGVREKKWAA